MSVDRPSYWILYTFFCCGDEVRYCRCREIIPVVVATFDWDGVLRGRERPAASELERLSVVVRRSEGGSGAFLGRMESDRLYWVKGADNPQGAQSVVTDRLVSLCGRALGAPVRPIALVEISTGVVADGSWRPVIAHGSLHLAGSVELDRLDYLDEGDNRIRLSFLSALWDWCMGSDPQYLYDPAVEHQIWSFDHGFWLTGETGWSPDLLVRLADEPWCLACDSSKADGTSLLEAADRLDAISAEQCISIAANIPQSWGVPDGDLEVVAWLLDRRRGAVVNRLRAAYSDILGSS